MMNTAVVTKPAVVSLAMDALFRNAHEAMAFACRFDSEQYKLPAMNKMAGPAMSSGKGLSGYDGAAQAGMIRGEIAQLGPLHEAIVLARFIPRLQECGCHVACCSGHRPNPEWMSAIDLITQAALFRLSGKMSNLRLRRGIVINQFVKTTDRTKISELADRSNVDRGTAADHNSIVATWLSGLRTKPGRPGLVGEIDKAIEAAGNRLLDAGFIGGD